MIFVVTFESSRISRALQLAHNPRILTRMLKDDDEALRRRFESHLPKYGTLWKSMAPKRQLLSAIESKSTISIHGGYGNGCLLFGCSDGTCSAPIEIDDVSEVSSETSSGGSTVGFDLSNLQIHDDVECRRSATSSPSVSVGDVIAVDASDIVLERGEQDSPAEYSEVKGLTKNPLAVERGDDLSLENFQAAYQHEDCDNDNSTSDDDDSNSDDSSGGSTVIRFDISHLQDECESAQSDEEFEFLPPMSPSLKSMDHLQLVNTPTGENEPSVDTWNKRHVLTLVEDDDSIDDSWVRPKVPTKQLEILSDSDNDSDSEVQWTELIDSEISDGESQQSEKSIISISDDGSSAHDSPITRPQKPQQNKGQFRRIREQLTNEAFQEFNMVVFEGKLSTIVVTWSSKLRTTAGVTRCTKDMANPNRRFATIELSMKVIDEHHRLRHTLLHEMCHAAQWLIDGEINPPHGACFKKWANHAMSKIQGAVVTTTHDFAIQYKYAWACTVERCGAVFQRQSKSIDVDKHVCGKCKGRLQEINVPQKGVKAAAIDRTPKEPKALNGYTLFVKENSAQVRSRLELDRSMCGSKKTVSQPEVMRECAKLWRVQQKSPS